MLVVPVLLAACTFDSSGLESQADTRSSEPSTGTSPAPGDTLGTDGQLSDGQISGLDDGATETGGRTDDDDDDASSSTSTGESSTGDEPVASARLSHVDFERCVDPVWCVSIVDGQPRGGPLWLQECFKSSVAPPFQVERIDVVIAEVRSVLDPFEIEIRRRELDGSPGGRIWYDTIPGAGLDEGLLHIDLDLSSPVVDTPGFCVGFYIESPGLAGALGIAVDRFSDVENASYVRGCSIPSFTDLHDLSAANPGRNWCVAVDVKAVAN